MRNLALLLALFLPISLWSQTRIDFGKKDNSPLTSDFIPLFEDTRNTMYEQVPEAFRDAITDRAMMRFANESAQNLDRLLKSEFIYRDWNELNRYVNAILDRIKSSAGLSDQKHIHAYVLKEGYPNAFMTPTGALFINIAVLAEIKSESNLAGIIAHELAHYTLNHNIEGFIKEIKGDFKPNLFFNAERAASRFSVEHELDADELASQYLVNAGYSYNGIIEACELIRKEEIKELLRDSYSYKIKEVSHPSSQRRIELFLEKRSKVIKGEDQGKDILISRILFNALQKKAKAEVLKYLLASYDYRSCIEKAFKYHLYEPNNPTYVYYLLEAIRRMCYLNIDQWNSKFLIDAYYEFTGGIGEGMKRRIEGDFFDKFRHDILSLSEEDFDGIEARFYWEGEAKFSTYEQAYQFFFEVGKLLEEPECYLSIALSLSFDKEKRDFWLTKYLDNKDIRYPEFANALLRDSIHQELGNRRLLVFDNLIGVIKQNADNLVLQNSETDVKLKEVLQTSVQKFGNTDYLYLKDLIIDRLDTYTGIANLEKLSFSVLFSKGHKPELYILFPEYWYLFKELGVNKIEFINCIYKEKAKGKYTKEDYLEVANSHLDDYLTKSDGKSRDLNIYISSLSIKKDEPMKQFYFDDEMKIEGTGYNHLVKSISIGLEKLEDSDR